MSRRIVVSSQALLLLTIAVCRPSFAATASCVVPLASLVSWWTGDADASDLYGVNNPSHVGTASLVPGKVADGITFGSGGFVDIPASPTLANQKFTWDAWVRPDGPGPNDDSYGSVIVQQAVDASTEAVSLWWSAINSRFRFGFGNLSTEVIVSADAFPPGSFYFVAATYDGATFRLYVNGVLEGSFAEAKRMVYSTTNTWGIGSTNAAFRSIGYPRTWNGVIDEVQAFKVALPQTKLQSIYKAGSVGTCKAPVLVTPTSLSFPAETVGVTSPAKAVTIINNRNVVVSMDGFAFTGANTGDFGDPSTTCGSTLAARKSCKVEVTFAPLASGKRSAVLNVNDSATGSPQTINLAGTGK
jgi:hypothetical protein